MNSSGFDKKSAVEEDSKKQSLKVLELKQKDNIDNTECLKDHSCEILQNAIGNNDQNQEVLTMETTQTSIGTQNEICDSVKYVDELVQKEALGIDINIQENFSEDAIKEDTESTMPQTETFIIKNTHIENNDEPTQEVSTIGQPITSMSIQNNSVIDCKEGLKSSLAETSTSLKNAKKELKVLETSKIVQNILVGEVQQLNISGQIANRKNESEVIVKNKSQSLKNLLVYSDEEEYDDGESNDVHEINEEKLTVRSSDSESDSESDSDSVSDSDSESDSDSDTESSESDNSSSESESEARKKNLKVTSVTKEDEYKAEVPHVADLSELEVDYEKEEFSHIGEISAIIDTTVTITTISGTPVYNIGSILFIEDDASKKPLGEIYDVIGPVASPIYCIGFKSAKEIKELGIKRQMKVYSAPKSHLSKYVFLKELMEATHIDPGTDVDSDDNSDVGSERLSQKRKVPTSSKNNIEHRRKGRGRRTMKHQNYRNRQVDPQDFNGWNAQNAVGGPQQSSFASNSGAQASFDPSIPPPLHQNNSSWITPPNAHPPPSWNNGDSSNGPQNWIMQPNLRTPPQWNSNPSFNQVPNMPPPQYWNNCPRIPPNIRFPQRFAGYRQNTPFNPRPFTRSYQDNYPYATAPPRWQPRTHPYQPIRYGSSVPNAPPMTGSNQSLNWPGKDGQ